MGQSRRSLYPGHVRTYAVDLWRRGLSPEEVASRLSAEAKALGIETTPHENTIKAWVRGQKRDGSEPWRLSSATAEEAELLRPVVDYLLHHVPSGWPTARQAGWIARIRRLVPNLDGAESYRIATRFIEAEDAEDADRLRQLELLVLLNPWEPRTAARGRYLDLIEGGTIGGEWFRPGAAGVASEAPYFEDVTGQIRRVAAALKARRERR